MLTKYLLIGCTLFATIALAQIEIKRESEINLPHSHSS
jgi:hypothetical protein